jgi:hypothetical protein
VGINEDREHSRSEESLSADPAVSRSEEQKLLEAVLRETMGSTNREALELLFAVARQSAYPDTTHIEAVEEVVQAIVKNRFGSRKFPPHLIHRIACTLIEAPEATIKLERLWQEARTSG